MVGIFDRSTITFLICSFLIACGTPNFSEMESTARVNQIDESYDVVYLRYSDWHHRCAGGFWRVQTDLLTEQSRGVIRVQNDTNALFLVEVTGKPGGATEVRYSHGIWTARGEELYAVMKQVGEGQEVDGCNW